MTFPIHVFLRSSLLWEACSALWNHQQSDRDLMRAAHKAVPVLYNHTGEVVCYSLDNTLRNNAGWGFQVRKLNEHNGRFDRSMRKLAGQYNSDGT